jgi:hypothetical protein
MGLLDDAIREHLELKRLRGADPGLVAHEEHEAFGPASDGESATDEGAPPMDDHTQTSRPDDVHGFSSVGQETAELDMRTVLDNEPGRDLTPVGPATPIAVGPVGGRPLAGDSPPEQGAAGDSLEWEMPGDGASEDAGEHIEDDRRADARDLRSGGAADQSGEPVEDVLEETHDFLHDTPGQEPLFEQRPRRDFDLDK